jgi:hypothetical protein
MGSRSETIEQGILCRRTTMSKKALVTVVDVYECPKGMKCMYLENLSTTEVHGHIGPDDGRHVEGLQETRQVEML